MGVTNSLRSLRSLCQHAKDLFLWFSFIYLFYVPFFSLFISFHIVSSVLHLRVYDDIHSVAPGLVHRRQPKYWYFSVIFLHIIFILHEYVVNWCSSFLSVFFFYTLNFINQKHRQMIFNDGFEFKGSPVIFVAQLISCQLSAVANQNSFDVK